MDEYTLFVWVHRVWLCEGEPRIGTFADYVTAWEKCAYTNDLVSDGVWTFDIGPVFHEVKVVHLSTDDGGHMHFQLSIGERHTRVCIDGRA